MTVHLLSPQNNYSFISELSPHASITDWSGVYPVRGQAYRRHVEVRDYTRLGRRGSGREGRRRACDRVQPSAVVVPTRGRTLSLALVQGASVSSALSCHRYRWCRTKVPVTTVVTVDGTDDTDQRGVYKGLRTKTDTNLAPVKTKDDKRLGRGGRKGLQETQHLIGKSFAVNTNLIGHSQRLWTTILTMDYVHEPRPVLGVDSDLGTRVRRTEAVGRRDGLDPTISSFVPRYLSLWVRPDK